MNGEAVTFIAAHALNEGVLLFWRGEEGSDGLAAPAAALTYGEQRSGAAYLLVVVQDLEGGRVFQVSGEASPEVRRQFKAALKAARQYAKGQP